jgi:hypothetical protein
VWVGLRDFHLLPSKEKVSSPNMEKIPVL